MYVRQADTLENIFEEGHYEPDLQGEMRVI